MKNDLSQIQKLVGAVTDEQLRYVDSFVGENIGLFMPVGGSCFYALTPLHTHPSYMFVLPFNEQTSLKIGERIIHGRHGKLMALSPDIPHHELPSDSLPRYIAIFIHRDFFEKELSQYPVNQALLFNGEFYEVSPDLLPLLKRFMIEADNKIPGSEAVLHALSLEICHSIIRGMFDFVIRRGRITSRIEIDRIIEYMHSNIGQKLTVDEMAKITHMSASHFSRVFKKEIGTPPMDYLHQIRMERVKRLLMAGDKPITEIALECGFNSSAYLAACFSKRYKTTPSEYQNGLKNGRIY
jgi:AraC-like DNA-binding protein